MCGRIGLHIGVVKKVLDKRGNISEILVIIKGQTKKAINYQDLTGKVLAGDKVLLNTTGVELGLGTGGYHFVQANLTKPQVNLEGGGHIMKLRYTPGQFKVLSVEEEAAGFHKVFKDFTSLKGFPVLIFSLHSALAPVVLSLKLIRPQGKIIYIMTDGGALPAAFSHTLSLLRKEGLLGGVITVGQAFGGDLEAVNIFSALITAKEIMTGDVAIVGMGPGNVGTGTKWGFSGIQLGEFINAVNILGGRAIFCPRISFSDPRPRHLGISHHSLTVLSQVALTSAEVIIPKLPKKKKTFIEKQLITAGIPEKHNIIWEHGERAWQKLQDFPLPLTTMGRGIKDEKEFFLGACASGIYTGKILG